MKTSHALTFATAAFVLANPAAAQVLSEVLSTETSGVEVEIDNGELEANAFAEIDTPATPNLVVDYATLGDTVLSVTWSAPVGQRFVIAPPDTGYDFDGVFLNATYGTTSFPGGITPTGTVVSHDITASNGITPGFDPGISLTGPGGDAVAAEVGLVGIELGETYTFTTLTLEAPIPASYDIQVDSAFLNYSLFGDLFFQSDNPNPDLPPNPGQWIRLAPIPEPASAALLSLGGMALLRSRRR